MKIAVFLKETPDTEAKILPSADGHSIATTNTKNIINPYDEYAIEEALKIKAKIGQGEVVIISFGGASVKERILKALAMGADRGILVNNEGLQSCDSLTTAKILTKAVRSENPQIILCGKQGIDSDNMHVGPMTAELLGWPHINAVTKMELSADQKTVTASREIEGGQEETYEVQLPCLFGAHKSLNIPRYASLPGIMKAKKKPLTHTTPADLGLDVSALTSSIKTTITGYQQPPQKEPGKIFKDEPVDKMAHTVATLLRNEAKVL